jgi:neutral ceramidase
MPEKLLAGASTSNITPALGCSLAGGMTDRIGAEVHDELHVRCLVLDNGQTRLAFALCDLCVLPKEQINQAKHLINSHTGIPMTNILVAATHTHSAPPAAHLFQSVPDPKYQEWLVVRIADGVRRAVNHLQPARVGWGIGREERLVFNRRYFMKRGAIPPNPFGRTTDQVLMNPGMGNANVVKPAGPVDPDAGVIAVESTAGQPIAVLGNYALHYVGGEGPGHISADYFGVWADSMVRLSGAGPSFVGILSNGCSGNINNVDVRAPAVRYLPYVKMQQVADILAAECYRTWRAVPFHDWVELSATVEELELEVRLPGPDDVAAARKLLASAGSSGPYKERPQIYARETLFLDKSWPRRVHTSIQALRIGSLGVATFPGEAFVELGMEVKAISPFRPTILIELANDYLGYIPTVEGHELGGYETWRAKSSFLETQAAPKMVAAALRGLAKLAP